MRNKTPLVLIEQMIMLLVFALAAALCLRAFAWADTQSKTGVLQDQALMQAQSAAEILKDCAGDYAAAAARWGGNWDQSVWTVQLDENWQQTEKNAVYFLRVFPKESGLQYLGAASVEVFREEVLLAALDVAWQEVAQDG